MELGNMIFGHSRGEYPIEDRDTWQEVFFNEFLYKINGDSYGYIDNEFEYINDIFEIRAYDWDAECDCGYEQLEEEWREDKKHKDDCYQTLVKNELIKNGWTVDKFGYLDSPKGISYNKKEKIENGIRKKYCKQFNLSFPEGSAVHCTCGLDDAFDKWCESNYHKENCRLLKPNFLYKPTGFKIMWYKYPLRDSYMNQNISLDEFKEILEHCVKSYY